MNTSLLDGSFNVFNTFRVASYRRKFKKSHPTYFDPDGLLVFCGPQGSGKTLSAVQYTKKVADLYIYSVFCTNVSIKSMPVNCYYEIEEINDTDYIVYYRLISSKELVRKVTVREVEGETTSEIEKFLDIKIVVAYDGLNCIKYLANGLEGVLYLIDEIHLEFNSLESKNIPIEIMVEVSQQRKQRKHIVGTSQVFMRMAKPLREQIKDVVICKNFFHSIQFNRLIDGDSAIEKNGKLVFDTVKYSLWFHSPELYSCYDTYAKMKRYRNEWHGVQRSNIYNLEEGEMIK